MRDRRLIIPALALVVAIIAVPIALWSRSEGGTAAPAACPARADPREAAAPAVLTEQLGVRDYRERLEQLKSKNPFTERFTFPENDRRREHTPFDPAGRTSGGQDPAASASTRRRHD